MTRGRYERKRLSRDGEARRARFLSHCDQGPQGQHEPIGVHIGNALGSQTTHLGFVATCRHCYRSVELMYGDTYQANQWCLRQFVIEELPDAG